MLPEACELGEESRECWSPLRFLTRSGGVADGSILTPTFAFSFLYIVYFFQPSNKSPGLFLQIPGVVTRAGTRHGEAKRMGVWWNCNGWRNESTGHRNEAFPGFRDR